MSEVAQYTEVHRHPEPKGFVWKYIFSLDHKVIGIQYLLLALMAAFLGMGLSLLVRMQAGLAERTNRLSGNAVPGWRARRRHDPRVLPVDADDARHDHGVHGAHDGASGWVRQLYSADPDRGRGHGLPAAQHAVVLDHLCLVLLPDYSVLRARRRTDERLDGVSALERASRSDAGRHRPGLVDPEHRAVLHRLTAGSLELHRHDPAATN